MPTHAIPPTDDLTPQERRSQVAAILANGVFRHCQIEQLSPSRDTGLELSSKTRLSVSRRLAPGRRDPECEVNDGRNA